MKKTILILSCILMIEIITGCFIFREANEINEIAESINKRIDKDTDYYAKLEYLERQIEQGDITKTELLEDIKEYMKRNKKLQEQLEATKTAKKVISGKKIKNNTIVINKIDCDSVGNLLIKDNVQWTERYKVKGIKTKDKSKEKIDNSVKTKTASGFWFGYLFGIGTVVILLLVYFYFKKK